jgi:hypothetical protein
MQGDNADCPGTLYQKVRSVHSQCMTTIWNGPLISASTWDQVALTCGNGNTIQLSVSLFSFLYTNPQCLTDVRQAMRALSLMMGFQVDSRCNSRQRQNFFLCLHFPTNLVVHPTSYRRALGSHTDTATNFQCNLTSSPPTHHSPTWSVKFRNTCGLIYSLPIRHPCMVLRLNINQQKFKIFALPPCS